MTKRNKIICWIATIWLASGMLSTGTLQLFKAKAEGALARPGSMVLNIWAIQSIF